MTSIERLHQQATQLDGAGRHAEAEAILRQILAREPAHAPTLHALGLSAFRRRRFDEALAALEKAVASDPAQAAYPQSLGEVFGELGDWTRAKRCFAEALRRDPQLVAAHYHLGLVCQRQQDWDGAFAALSQVVRLQPQRAEAHAILGNLLQSLGRIDDAIASFETATRLKPDLMAAHFNLGNSLRLASRYAAAAESYRQALRLAPDFAQAHNNLGMVLQQLDDDEGAAAAFSEAVRLAPDSAEAHYNFGVLLKRARKFTEAKALLARAIELDPAHAPSHFNLGSTLFALRDWDGAGRCYLAALGLRSDYAEPHYGLGILAMARGQYGAAQGHFDRSLAIEPDLAEAHCNRGMLWLIQGRFAAGWPEYEWRWRAEHVQMQPPGPRWQGEPLRGRTILVNLEQGNGDTIQFIRYAPLVKAQGGHVIVLCPRRLLPLLRTCPGIDEFYSYKDGQSPPYHVHATLMDLPRIFGTEIDSIPADVPYLSAPDDAIEHWRGELGHDGVLRVGINWQGNPNFPWDPFRSVALTELGPLAEIEGLRLISLQKGFGIEQLAAAPFSVEDWGSRLDHDAAFCDTAALIKNLDLVVTTDTAVAHLAGALAAPVWTVLSFGPDWRWLLDREDSPWYPTMRLFRQPRFGDWAAVFARVAAELSRLASRAAAKRADLRGDPT